MTNTNINNNETKNNLNKILVGILIIFGLIIGGVSAETVLIETFARDGCGICVYGNGILENIVETHKEDEENDVFLLEYHLDDALANAKTNQRRSFYGGYYTCNYYLYPFFNGKNGTCPPNYNYEAIITEHLKIKNAVEIAPFISANGDELGISVAVNKYEAVGENLNLYMVIVEDLGYVDAKHTVRDYITKGFYIENYTQIEFNYTLSNSTYQNRSNIDLTFFVQRNNKEIIDSFEVDLLDNNSPALNFAVPEYTNNETLFLNLKTEKCVNVTINEESFVSFNGSISITMNLSEGENSLALCVGDAMQNLNCTTKTVVLDTINPFLTVYLENGTNINKKRINISGITEINASLKINDEIINVTENGSFNKKIELDEEFTCVHIEAIDLAGNVNETTLCMIVHNPCDPNYDGIYIHDHNDLMYNYNCFLGINKNCDTIHFRDWQIMKQEYECFVNNQQ